MAQSRNLFDGKIIGRYIEEEMQEAYIDYAMSVIVGRALPDVRDGLKPVHRRILFAMKEKSWDHSRPYVKCAKIVGEVLGNFHPHGDASVYDSLVRMAQPWSLRYMLIDGQGNFGSIDGDNPAAYRYTEARMSSIASFLLNDIDKNTVDFTANFDETRKEPEVLPSSFPNLLVNGSSGIAVGMATNIPPHNLKEVINGINFLIDNPEANVKELMKYIPGPDFPTNGIIHGREGIRTAYTTGRGKIQLRGKADIEENKKGHEFIIISELPYQVNKLNLITKIAELVNSGKIDGIKDIRDESDKEGMRVVLDIRKGYNSTIILNQLYKYTQLQVTFSMILLALVKKQPKIMSLKTILEEYITHRKEVVTRRTKFDLDKAEARAHILDGLIIALEDIDNIIKLIKNSKSVPEAKSKLMKKYHLSELQAQAILDMKLQRLTSLEKVKVMEERKSLAKLIKELKSILASPKKVFMIIKYELSEIAKKYGDSRKTSIENYSPADFTDSDLIANDEMVITITKKNFIKRIPIDTYKRQNRGGKGIIGSKSKTEDFVVNIFTGRMHDNLLLFSNKGKVFLLKILDIEESSRTARGKTLKTLINLSNKEYITAAAVLEKFDEKISFVMVTKKGIIKRLISNQFVNATKGGIIALNLSTDDKLIYVATSTSNNDDIIISTKTGYVLRFSLKNLRPMGRTARGVIGIRLRKEDEVVGMDIIQKQGYLLSVTQFGYGKRTKVKLFPKKSRGGKGVIYQKIVSKSGYPISARIIQETDEILIISHNGQVVRIKGSDISIMSRNATGVKLVSLDKEDYVTDFSVISLE